MGWQVCEYHWRQINGVCLVGERLGWFGEEIG